MNEKNEKQTSELSMEELDNVAGGAVDNFLWFPESAKGNATAVAPTGPATPPTPSTTPGH